MNVNLVYITNDPMNFNMEKYEHSSNWIGNCFGQNFFCVNTGAIVKDIAVLDSLPFNNIANANNHLSRCSDYAHVIKSWWETLHDIPLIKHLDLHIDLDKTLHKGKLHESKANLTTHPIIQEWSTWMAALDIINVDNNEPQAMTVLTKNLDVVPSDLAKLATQMEQIWLQQENESFMGGGIHEVNPINGCRHILLDKDREYVIGHYHALIQMFKMETFKQAWANVELTLSTVNKVEIPDLYQLVSNHLGLTIKHEIT